MEAQIFEPEQEGAPRAAAGRFRGRRYHRAAVALYDGARKELLDCVARSPGIPLAEVATLLGRSYGAISYHARVLESFGCLVIVATGRFARFYLPGAVKTTPVAMVEGLANPHRVALLRAIADQPRATGARLSRALRLARTTTHVHLHRLQEFGLVEGDKSGRIVAYRLTDLGRDALARAEDAAADARVPETTDEDDPVPIHA